MEKAFNKSEQLFSVQTEMITEEDLPPMLKWVEGDVSKSSTEGLETTILRLWKINAPVTKKLEEARGYIIADFQDELEKEWVEHLKTEYPIQVNQDAFEKLVRT